MSLVLIDDSDPVVKYNTPGGWIETGVAQEFKQTTHASATPGDTATLVFEGTSISVYGSQAPSSGESRLKFSVDGTDVGSYQPAPVTGAIHNQLFWTSPIFDEASHTLVITVDPSDTSSQQESPLKRAFYLDYFTYQTTSTAGKTVVIDDNDPSVTYSPKWNLDHSDSRLESTRHVSNSQLDGAWAAVSFNGTGISLFGSSGSPGPDQGFKASVAIDGSQLGTVSDSQNQTPLFDSGALPAGPHTINVTVLDGRSLVIDYFLVKNDLEIPFVTSTAGSSASASEGTVVPSPLGTAQVSKAPPIAAIVGGAVGGLVLLLLLLVAALMWRRRERRSNQPALDYPVMSDPWAGKRISVTSMTTLTEDNESQRPKNFEKQRPPSRYMYYE